jgi:hypothetical protein
MQTARTDVHRPAALVTEDYEYFASGYYGTFGEPGYSPMNTPKGHELLNDGWTFDSTSGGGCDHCGARLKYYALMLHAPSHKIVRVGETCLANRFERATADFHSLRKQAQLDRQQQRIRKARAAWFAINEDRFVAFEWARHMVEVEGAYGYEGMRGNFVSKVNRDGMTSDKFVSAIMRDMVRTERREEERTAEAAKASPVVEGKGTVTGEVVSVKWQENDFGGRMVMTVRDDRGFVVWGTVPAAIDDVERGDRVRFDTTVTTSDRDETFGFFKRPRSAAIL